MLCSVLLRRVALASIASLALASSSCLVTSIDSFPDPPRTPPFLSAANAAPPLRQLLLVDPRTSGPITFSASVRSEDAGTPLLAQLQVDWPQNDRGTIDNRLLGTGSFSEQRTVALTWQPGGTTFQGQVLAPGCHTFTMVVTHGFNFTLNTPVDPADSDTLLWWVFIGSSDDFASFDLSQCATTNQTPATSPTSTSLPISP